MNDLHEMLECFWQWARIDPDNSDVWYGIGIAFLRLGYHDYAVRAFRKVLAIDPGNTSAWIDLGAVYNETGRYAEAALAYREAIKIDPDKEEACSGLALTYVLLTNPSPVLETIPDFDPAIADILSDLMIRMG
jgi:Flp pilus assembly protein TadD